MRVCVFVLFYFYFYSSLIAQPSRFVAIDKPPKRRGCFRYGLRQAYFGAKVSARSTPTDVLAERIGIGDNLTVNLAVLLFFLFALFSGAFHSRSIACLSRDVSWIIFRLRHLNFYSLILRPLSVSCSPVNQWSPSKCAWSIDV